MDSQYSKMLSMVALESTVGCSRAQSSTDRTIIPEPAFTAPRATEQSLMGHTTNTSALTTAHYGIESQQLAPDSDNVKILKQQNAALLARVVSLESTNELQQRRIQDVSEERNGLIEDLYSFHHPMSDLGYFLGEALIELKKKGDSVDKLDLQAEDLIISDLRQKNMEISTELETYLILVESLEDSVQRARDKEQETAKQLCLARSALGKELGGHKKARGPLHRRINQNAKERCELIAQNERVISKYQDVARSQFHILQSYKETIEELEDAKAEYLDEKERHEGTWSLMVKAALSRQKYCDMATKLKEELGAKNKKIEEQQLKIHKHECVLDEVCHILNSLSPELKKVIQEENRIRKEKEFEFRDEEDETCSNYSNSGETTIHTIPKESARHRTTIPDRYRHKFL